MKLNKFNVGDIVIKEKEPFKVVKTLIYGPGTIYYTIQRINDNLRNICSEKELILFPTKQNFILNGTI